jgi:histidinol-phosphatase (PHP family)
MHAVGEMEEYVAMAVQRGLARIVFLEHLETEILYQPRCWLEDVDFADYFEQGTALKQRFQGVIDVQLGAETGFNPAAVGHIRERLARFPYDRIGLSCHFFRHEATHLNLLSRRRQSLDQVAAIGADQVVTAYFDSLTKAVKVLDCDVLCHLDAVLRHFPGIEFNKAHHRQILTLLDGMQEKGVALEINTSGFDYRGFPFPAPWIITEALRRGIPLLAGSDAHQPQEVGRYFQQLPEYLEKLNA